jgi:preprotein translocase subunit SecY
VRGTWTVAIVLALFQAGSIAAFLERQNSVTGGLQFLDATGWGFRLSTMLMLTAGSACLMWIGDRITERHIGNGMFLVFVAALLAGLPALVEIVGLSVAVRDLMIPVFVAGITSYGYRRAFECQQAT